MNEASEAISSSAAAARKPRVNLKGLVLSGGTGSRMRPFASLRAKQLIPVANKPVIIYAIEDLVAAGITEIGVVTGDTGAQIREALGDGGRFGARLTYIPQSAPLGLAHAVQVAREFLDEQPFVVFLGDNLLRGGLSSYVATLLESGADASLLLKRVPNPSDYGVAVLDQSGRPTKILEKPSNPPTDLAVIGVYFFRPKIFDAVRLIAPSARGEMEITDAIQQLIEMGGDVRASVVDREWVDVGRASDLLKANQIILGELRSRVDGTVDAGSSVSGPVVIEAGARVEDSVIVGPAIIGRDAYVVHSRIGPYTSLGEGVQIRETEISATVVFDRAIIDRPGKPIRDSVIGFEAEVRRAAPEQDLTLFLGDHSRVHLS